jgi:hemerythrin-like domain-containing protein
VRRVSRRGLLVGGAGLVVGAAATEGGNLAAPSSHRTKELTPAEDLMREHGVLKRVLLSYRAASDKLSGGTAVPLSAVHAGATVIHDYIEGFHEGLEEGYVFPALVHAGQLTDTVDTLLVQHGRGRGCRRGRGVEDPHREDPAATRTQLVADLTAFVRMYEPHEAREDTVIFPTLRTILSPQQLHDLSTTFTALEDKQFGVGEFDRMVASVTALEQSLGIYDLNQFTPAV